MSSLQVFLDQVAAVLPSKKRPLEAAAAAAAPAAPAAPAPQIGDDEAANVLLGFAQEFVRHITTRAVSGHSTTFIHLFETRDSDGLTLLHRLVAIGPSASSALALLASHRLCPLTVRSTSGQTPLDLAVETGNRVCARILDRAVQLRKLTPDTRQEQIRNMRESTAAARASQRLAGSNYHSADLMRAVQPLYEGLDRSV